MTKLLLNHENRNPHQREVGRMRVPQAVWVHLPLQAGPLGQSGEEVPSVARIGGRSFEGAQQRSALTHGL